MYEEQTEKKTIINKTVKKGLSFGSALAMVISYTTWHSVGWAIVHGLMSWVYVIYFILRYRKAARSCPWTFKWGTPSP